MEARLVCINAFITVVRLLHVIDKLHLSAVTIECIFITAPRCGSSGLYYNCVGVCVIRMRVTLASSPA